MNKPDKALTSKSFPWNCRECGKTAVWPQIVDYPVTVEYEGKVYDFTVSDLQSPQCRECRQVFPDAAANRQISQAFRCHANLLTPQQIRRNREALGFTQKRLAAILGVAEATISRWETGGQIQQRSLDNLLRIGFQFAEVRASLADEQVWPRMGVEVVRQSLQPPTKTIQLAGTASSAFGATPTTTKKR